MWSLNSKIASTFLKFEYDQVVRAKLYMLYYVNVSSLPKF